MDHIFKNKTEIYDFYFANALDRSPKEITSKQLTQWGHDVVSNATSIFSNSVEIWS